jgi:hypothetical protein
MTLDQMNQQDDDLLGLMKISIAAHFCAVTPKTIRKWIRQGLVPVYGRGRVYRVKLEDVMPRRNPDLISNNPKGRPSGS